MIFFCSTCSVAILPQLSDDSDFKILDSELKFEFMRSSGAGGQNVNVNDTACRVLHLPTGLAIKSQVRVRVPYMLLRDRTCDLQYPVFKVCSTQNISSVRKFLLRFG